MLIHSLHIRKFEIGLKFVSGEFAGLLEPGRHFLIDLLGRMKIRVVSKRDTWLYDEQLDLIIKSGQLAGKAEVVDLKDHQRGLVWIEGRFARILGPGQHVYWLGNRDIQVEIVDVRQPQFQHSQLQLIATSAEATRFLDVCRVQRDMAGVLFVDGKFESVVGPGLYAFWRNGVEARIVEVDLRESAQDIAGQEIMTVDKVTLRVNAAIAYKVLAPHQFVSDSVDPRQTLYREAQLALRTVIGTRELDKFLIGKDEVAEELKACLAERASELGAQITSVGIRDIILPGEMKDLMNKVTEAKKQAEANLIVRREETAAMRNQANTAKLLADNPTLMRLRELEVLEKVATAGTMQVVLGESGLTDRLVKMI